jgi:hypothetical protein
VHSLKPDWPNFLDDFQHHWPTDDDHTYVDFVREGVFGNGAVRTIKSILQNGLDKVYANSKAPDGPPIRHANIRGHAYYH